MAREPSPVVSLDAALAPYRDRRDAERTPEPFGDAGLSRPGLFVLQEHGARGHHWDLRLEIGGVLASWALPKGLSLDPKEKRLAVATEDHPLEYADFEGVIPEGEYGAGPMIVWDRGRATHHLDPAAGRAEGKLLFELHGHKVRGLFTLVRTGRDDGGDDSAPGRHWLLIKKPDEHAVEASGGEGADGESSDGEADLAALAPGSVLSGLDLDELARGVRCGAPVARRLRDRGAEEHRPSTFPGDDDSAATRPLRPADVRPLLPTLEPRPFSRPGWLFEIKYDGFRAVAGREPDGRPRILYRSGRDATAAFPELARALAALPVEDLVLDGEVVVHDGEGKPSFSLLQRRAPLTRAADTERAAALTPATLYAFDLLGLDGLDLRPLPLVERKAALREVLPAAGPLRFVDAIEERGEAVWRGIARLGLEGMVAKRADSAYRGGRSRDWIKVRAGESTCFAIVGFRLPETESTADGEENDRAGAGDVGAGDAGGDLVALHLGLLEAPAGDEGATKGEAPRLVYAGRVGAGLVPAERRRLRRALEAERRADPTAGKAPTGDRRDVWVEPRRVVEVRYAERTARGHLRHPAVVALRDDLSVGECVDRTGAPGGDVDGDFDPPPESAGAGTEVRPAFEPTNLDKVYWPAVEAVEGDDGEGSSAALTKGDLLAHYRRVAPVILPYLADRPLVLDRYPDGIDGESFFQRNAPESTPEWVRTVSLWNDDTGSAGRLFVCDDLDTLLYLANLGSIPLHLWSARVARPQHPDWVILDLDAKDAPFPAVVRVARIVHDLAREAELPAFVKTSGATGLHVLLPSGGHLVHAQARQMAELLARLAVAEAPEIASVARSPAGRRGKVYVDFLQNGYGKLLVAPWCPRPLPGAPVSTPLAWDALERPDLSPREFTLESLATTAGAGGLVPEDDPWRGLFEAEADWRGALERLADRVG